MKYYSTWTGIWNYEKFTGGTLPTKVFFKNELILYKSNTSNQFLDMVLETFGDPKNWTVVRNNLYVSSFDYIIGDVEKLENAKKEAIDRWEEKST